MQAYASNYVGHAKVERLLFIAEKKQGTAFGDDALRLALEELSQVSNAFAHVLSHSLFSPIPRAMHRRAITPKSIKK